jgi:hypothetical protein|tara:strand:+ start:665 stop:829 length:165 start_codon:yes stop_codon:yes gene_type:complete
MLLLSLESKLICLLVIIPVFNSTTALPEGAKQLQYLTLAFPLPSLFSFGFFVTD